MSPWLTLAAVAVAGLCFVAAGLGVNWLLRPRLRPADPHVQVPDQRATPRAVRRSTYESGVDAVGSGWSQSYVRYYALAFVYVVFAVDTAYLFVWAVVVKTLGWVAALEMGVFLAVLTVALVHAWRHGVGRWV